MSEKTKVNIFLDDVRTEPKGWIRTKTFDETVNELYRNYGNVGTLSLDHDLGDDEAFGTGYHVVTFLEENAYHGVWDLIPDQILVHSANPVGMAKMIDGIHFIEKMRNNSR